MCLVLQVRLCVLALLDGLDDLVQGGLIPSTLPGSTAFVYNIAFVCCLRMADPAGYSRTRRNVAAGAPAGLEQSTAGVGRREVQAGPGRRSPEAGEAQAGRPEPRAERENKPGDMR